MQKPIQVELNDIKATIPNDLYPKNVNEQIAFLSLDKNKLAVPFGSYIYRMQKYPADIDLIETYDGCCSVDDVINNVVTSIQKIVNLLDDDKNRYFTEFKAGLDNRFDVDIGRLQNGIWIEQQKFGNAMEYLMREKLLTNERLKDYVYGKLTKRWSPEQMANSLKDDYTK
jgi:hypothetical protein